MRNFSPKDLYGGIALFQLDHPERKLFAKLEAQKK